MESENKFDIDKHLSRLISYVKKSSEDLPAKKNSKPIKHVKSNLTKKDVAEIVKNAIKLDTMGQYEESLSWYNIALQIDSQNTDTMLKKALLLSKTKKYEDAVVLLDQILEINPTLVSAHINRKIILGKLGKHFGVAHLSDKQFS